MGNCRSVYYEDESDENKQKIQEQFKNKYSNKSVPCLCFYCAGSYGEISMNNRTIKFRDVATLIKLIDELDRPYIFTPHSTIIGYYFASFIYGLK